MKANLKDVWVHCSTAHNDFLDFKPLRTKDGGVSDMFVVWFGVSKLS